MAIRFHLIPTPQAWCGIGQTYAITKIIDFCLLIASWVRLRSEYIRIRSPGRGSGQVLLGYDPQGGAPDQKSFWIRSPGRGSGQKSFSIRSPGRGSRSIPLASSPANKNFCAEWSEFVCCVVGVPGNNYQGGKYFGNFPPKEEQRRGSKWRSRHVYCLLLEFYVGQLTDLTRMSQLLDHDL